MDHHHDILESTPSQPVANRPANPFVLPPPLEARETPASIRRLTRKFDPAARDARNRALGRNGEEFVLEVGRRLFDASQRALSARVRWVSDAEGDSAGYDVLSFDPGSGAERLIEVKTTRGEARTPFFITRNEESLARERPIEFKLYRVFEFGPQPKIFVNLETAAWKASFR